MSTAEVQYRSLDFLGFPKHRVGDDGSVWAYRLRGKTGTKRKMGWKQVQPRRTGGYHRVPLRHRNMNRWVMAHRLVLEAFVGPCPEGMECCHWDGVRDNNRLNNLRWDTRKNNAKDRDRHGTKKWGTKHSSSVLTEEQVRELRRCWWLYQNIMSMRAYCRMFAMKHFLNFNIVRGILMHDWRWPHVKV